MEKHRVFTMIHHHYVLIFPWVTRQELLNGQQVVCVSGKPGGRRGGFRSEMGDPP